MNSGQSGPPCRVGLLADAHDQLTGDLVRQVVQALAERHDGLDPAVGQVRGHDAADLRDAVTAATAHPPILPIDRMGPTVVAGWPRGAAIAG